MNAYIVVGNRLKGITATPVFFPLDYIARLAANHSSSVKLWETGCGTGGIWFEAALLTSVRPLPATQHASLVNLGPQLSEQVADAKSLRE